MVCKKTIITKENLCSETDFVIETLLFLLVMSTIIIFYIIFFVTILKLLVHYAKILQ